MGYQYFCRDSDRIPDILYGTRANRNVTFVNGELSAEVRLAGSASSKEESQSGPKLCCLFGLMRSVL
jgi:hypothetical protein